MVLASTVLKLFNFLAGGGGGGAPKAPLLPGVLNGVKTGGKKNCTTETLLLELL